MLERVRHGRASLAAAAALSAIVPLGAACNGLLGITVLSAEEGPANEGGVSSTGGGEGRSDASCPSNTKRCEAACVSVDDAAFGCGVTSCAPCAGANVLAFTCSNGACQVRDCAAGAGDCNADPSDGCETDLGSAATCGSCTNDCAKQGLSVCAHGVCASSCAAPGVPCPGGACVDTKTNARHCGTCGTVCPAQQATASCTNSTCAFTCSAGYLDCDKRADNACEQVEDATHCGAGCANCNPRFAAQHRAGACTAHSCVAGGCLPGWLDCDGNPSDCEWQGTQCYNDPSGTCAPFGPAACEPGATAACCANLPCILTSGPDTYWCCYAGLLETGRPPTCTPNLCCPGYNCLDVGGGQLQCVAPSMP
jgi:hypothetical protein